MNSTTNTTSPVNVFAEIANLRQNFWFLTETQAQKLAPVLPNLPVLVRRSDGRCVVPLKDLAFYIKSFEAGAGDSAWIRDVSIPAGTTDTLEAILKFAGIR